MPHHTCPGLLSDAGALPFFFSFRREIIRLIDQFRTGLPMPETTRHMRLAAGAVTAVDVVKTAVARVIHAEVSGIRQTDPGASVPGDVPGLKGNKTPGHEKNEGGYHRIDRRCGNSHRAPRPAERALEACAAQAVLILRIGKPAAAWHGARTVNISKT